MGSPPRAVSEQWLMGNNKDYIVCANCSRKIVPRLWHVTSFGVTRTQHICQFCGKILYVTGPKRAVVLVIGALHVFLRLMNLIGDIATGRRHRRY